MRLLSSAAALLVACAPPVEGAACTSDDNCPGSQRCSTSCRCESSPPAGGCPGYTREASLPLDAASASAVVQLSGRGEVAAVYATDSRGRPTTRLFVPDGGAWTRLGELEADGPSASPMGLSPTGNGLALRGLLGTVTHYRLPGLESFTPLWTSSARAVALAGETVVASFDGAGTRRKRVGDSLSALGTAIDTGSADELQLSNDGVVAARFGSEVRLYDSDGGRGSVYSDVKAIDLSADGRSVALVRDTGVEVAVGARRASVPLGGAAQAALDGSGRTLVALSGGAPAVFALDGGAWARVGALPIDEGVARGAALTDDGELLLIGVPSQRQVLVFRRLR
ncbi:MAG: hypothetical protein JNJ54_21235 [Myxococcaceae bacterium]|nr:hypothetical protein [Myxococcaceae bacterium]